MYVFIIRKVFAMISQLHPDRRGETGAFFFVLCGREVRLDRFQSRADFVQAVTDAFHKVLEFAARERQFGIAFGQFFESRMRLLKRAASFGRLTA